jgi:hypothetical protein
MIHRIHAALQLSRFVSFSRLDRLHGNLPAFDKAGRLAGSSNAFLSLTLSLKFMQSPCR